MLSPWELLKLLADPTRLRLVILLRREELSVAELQEILGMGQSRISTHLGLLRQNDLVIDRKEGKKSYYTFNPLLRNELTDLVVSLCRAVERDEGVKGDHIHLQRIIEKRRRASEEYFNTVAGRLGKNYCPGRSWEAIGHFLLLFSPRIIIADLGAGEGMLAQLLAQRAEQVYCIDNSPKMVEVGSELARSHNITNLSYKLGDIEQVPLPDGSVDLAYLSQALHHARHPQRAIAEAHRILKPGGRLVILDLKAHSFEKARELYADLWLGFAENTLYSWLKLQGFMQPDVRVVTTETCEPYFETVLATALKPLQC